jgi:hypothetical protein
VHFGVGPGDPILEVGQHLRVKREAVGLPGDCNGTALAENYLPLMY